MTSGFVVSHSGCKGVGTITVLVFNVESVRFGSR